MHGELDANTGGHDENDGWNGAKLDLEDSERAEKLEQKEREDGGRHAASPTAHKDERAHGEDDGEDGCQGSQQPESDGQVLFPIGERYTTRKVGKS